MKHSYINSATAFLLGVSLSIVSDTTNATLITFDDLPPTGATTTVTSGGFNFVSNPTPTGTVQLFVLSTGGCSPPCPDNGTQFLLHNDFGDGNFHSISMFQTSGLPFSLFSLEVGERHIGLNHAAGLEITGSRQDGGIAFASFDIDGLNDGPGPAIDFQQFLLPNTFRNLSHVTFVGPVDEPLASTAGVTQGYTLDNLAVRIPEPATILLIGLGVVSLITSRRREQTA